MRNDLRSAIKILLGLSLMLFGSSFAQPVINQGLKLETGQWTDLKDNPLTILPVFTVEFWIKASSRIVIVSRDYPASLKADWSVVYDYSRQRLEFMTQINRQPDEYFWSSDNSLQNGKWNHAAVVVNGSSGNLKIYINGLLNRSGTFTSRTFDAVTGLALGGYYNNSAGAGSNGYIDEVRYWNYERTQQQIQSAKDVKLSVNDRQGLMGYWMFCGNFADSSGNKNDMTPRGSPQIVDIPDLIGSLSCGTPFYPPIPLIVALGPTTFCPGDSVILDAGTGYSAYLWSTGEMTQTIIVRQTGTYTVTVTDANGLQGTSAPTRVTVNSSPAVPTITRTGDTLISSLADNYQWYLNGTMITGATNQRLIISLPGLYSVKVTNTGGCSSVSSPVKINIGAMTATAALSCVDSIAYNPGDVITIPLLLINSQNLVENTVQHYIAYIRFFKNVLQPIQDSGISFIDTGKERVVTIRQQRESTMNQGLLSELKCIVMLGDTLCTQIHFDSLVWTDGIVNTTIQNQDCKICVKSCNEGGTRLFSSEGKFTLKQNRPNPFNAATMIEYEINEDGFSQLYIMDVLGRIAATLVNSELRRGTYSASFDGSNLPSGIYFYVLKSPTQTIHRRMQLIK